MEYIIILIASVITIFVLKLAFQIKIKDIKKIKEIGYDKNLNDITNKLHENRQVCEEILELLKKKGVSIKISEDKNSETSFYSVMSNCIFLANINNTFTRIQTIAHECIHSTQNRKTLLFNFIFSNIYLLYFIVISILTLIRVIENPIHYIIILIFLSIIYFVIRSFLETDAMTKAPYLARVYMQKSNKLSNEDIETVMKNYEIINTIGIPLTNFHLIISIIIKIIIYCIISIFV